MAPDATALALEACYDAAFEFERWPGGLQKLADALGATSCALRTCEKAHPFAADQRGKAGSVPDSTEHAEFSALWHERIGDAPSPHLERPQLLAKPPISFTVEDEITTPQERRGLSYYEEIARPGHREWWALVGLVVKNRRWGVSLYRDAQRGPFYPSEADHFLRVAPDLSRIISTAEKLGELSVGPSLVTLDRLNFGAVLLDCRGCVRRFNERAAALFGSDLVVRHGRIRATDQPSDARLQGFIRAAVSGLSVRSEPVVITRQGYPRMIAEVMPMTALGRDLFNGGDILLYFTNLVTEPVLNEQLLSVTFKLTRAEARLASQLASGEGIRTASAKLGISRETARTQLRAVFAKTGTGRQAELAALLSRLSIPSRH